MPEYVGIIYVCQNRANGKMYVGQTIRSLEKRMWGHCNDALRGSSQAFHKALIKYGREGFDVYVAACCETRAELNRAEEFWIVKLKSLAPNGYNLTTGGGGPVPTAEVRRKMSDAGKGKKQSPEWIKKRFESRKGWKHSEETKAKLSEIFAHLKKPEVSKPTGPRIMSAETRAKLSASIKRSLAENPRRPWTEKERAAVSAQKKGIPFSEEHKSRISSASKGKPRPWASYKRSEETRQRMVEAWRIRKAEAARG
jgi:hypothetical protein